MKQLSSTLRALLKTRASKKSMQAIREFAEALSDEQWEWLLKGLIWQDGMPVPRHEWSRKRTTTKSECRHFTLLCSLAPETIHFEPLSRAHTLMFDGREATIRLFKRVRQIGTLYVSLNNLAVVLESGILAQTETLRIVTEDFKDRWLKPAPKNGMSAHPIDWSRLEQYPRLHVSIAISEALDVRSFVTALSIDQTKGSWPKVIHIASKRLRYLSVSLNETRCRLDAPNLSYMSIYGDRFDAETPLSLQCKRGIWSHAPLHDNKETLTELIVWMKHLRSPSLKKWPVMPKLRKLIIEVNQRGIEDLSCLATIAPNLRELHLNGPGWRVPLPLTELPELSEVEVVALNNQSHEDYFVFTRKFPNVKTIRIERCNAGDGQTLKRLKRLESVYASDTHDRVPEGYRGGSAAFLTARASMKEGPQASLPTVQEWIQQTRGD